MSRKINTSSKMFQWPEPASCRFDKKNPVYYKYKKNKTAPSAIKINKIEKFFSQKYKAKYAVLFPSGRAAINVTLKFHNFNRSKTVNVPLWTSSCLLHALTSITNVTVKDKKADCNIVVHKWGNTFKVNKYLNKNQLIIDDSADCLPNKKYKPFVSNTSYEILSLPKLIGSFCGGIVLTKNKRFYLYCKKIQKKNLVLSKKQSERKFISSFKDNNNFDWRFYESLNTSVDFNSVENVFNCLENFNLNLNTILRRQHLIKKKFKDITLDPQRVGPCLIFDKKKYKKFSRFLESKNFDFTKKILNEKYKECLIFPIHFGIPENLFQTKFLELLNAHK
jgi:putative PLP-dependent aminotransferase (TIGR04422 family)